MDESSERFLKLPLEDRFISFALVLLTVLTPTVFSRSIFYSFYLPQLTVFWLLGLVIFLFLIYKIFITGKVIKPPVLFSVSLIFFIFSLFLVSILSKQTWVSFTGLTARGAGVISYLLCVVVLISVFQLGQRNNLLIFIKALAFTHVLVAGYAILQKFDLDPVAWGAETESVGTQIFSTLGNSNFSAGYLVSTFPLLVWLAFSPALSNIFRTFLGACLGVSFLALVYFDSAQGDIAVLLALLPLVHWVFSHYNNRFLITVFVAAPIVVICLLPLATGQNELRFPFVWVFVSTIAAYFGSFIDQRFMPVKFSIKEIKKNLWVVSCLVSFLILGVFVFLLRDKILDEFQSGLDQRFEYWKATIKIFLSNPFFGTGLETFGSYFTMNRSVEHATNYPNVLTDSPHSVLLGFLSSGGLLLFLSYLGFLVVVTYFGIKAVRNAESLSIRGFYLAVLAAWVAYQLQSVVSIATPGLIYVQWILGGVLLSGGASGCGPVKIIGNLKRSAKRFKSYTRYKKPFFATLGIICFVILLGPVTAPIRANALAFKAQGEFIVGDYLTAEENLIKATKLQSKFPSYFTMLAVVNENQGKPVEAFSGFERAAALSPGNTSSAIEAAHSAIRLGKLDRADYWYQSAFSADPNNPAVILELVGFFASNGQQDRAMELLGQFENLQATQVSYWSYAAKVYDYFGETPHAKHAKLCSIDGQKGCGFLEAIIFEEQGNLSESINELKFIIDKDPRNVFAHLEIGRVLEKMEDLDSAKIWYLKALNLDQSDIEALTKSAEFFVSIGDLVTAYELLDKFEAIKSQSTSDWAPIAMLYEKIGDKKRYDRAYRCATGNRNLSNYQEGCWE